MGTQTEQTARGLAQMDVAAAAVEVSDARAHLASVGRPVLGQKRTPAQRAADAWLGVALTRHAAAVERLVRVADADVPEYDAP